MPSASVPAGSEGPASYVISLRPVGGHGPVARWAQRHGAVLIELSPWRIAHRDDARTRRILADALLAPVAVFTSPAAVAAAVALARLDASQALMLAVGAGTRAALTDAGVETAEAPARQDSEGLLALPALAAGQVQGRAVGLVTAPGGRGRIAEVLAARGARIVRADVYAREPVPLALPARAILRAAHGRLLLPVTSGEALQRVLDALPRDEADRLRSAHVIAASDRLAALASDLGFARVDCGRTPQPDALLDRVAFSAPG